MAARLTVGYLARIFILVAYVTIVVHCVVTLWQRGEIPLAIAAAIFNPVAFFVWPLFGTGAVFLGIPLWTLFVGTLVAYPISTFVGGLPPIERPRDLFSPHTWIATPLLERRLKREWAKEEVIDAGNRAVLDDKFEEVWERYNWKASQTDPVSADVGAALQMLRAWLGEELTEKAKNGLYTLAARGYLWREAEELEHSPVDFVDDEIRASIAASREWGQNGGPVSDGERGLSLFRAAAQCVEDEVPVWQGCPGGLLYGDEFYSAALDQVRTDFEQYGFEISENTQSLAFRFGVSLRDVERVLDGDSASASA